MAADTRGRLPDDWPTESATPSLLRFQVKEAGRLLYLAAVADDGLSEDDRELLSVIRENILPEAGIGKRDRFSGDDALGILLAWHEVAALLPDEEWSGSVTPLWYAARALRLAVQLLGYDPDGLFTPTMRSNAHGDDRERNDPEPRLNQGRSFIEGNMREEDVARWAAMHPAD